MNGCRKCSHASKIEDLKSYPIENLVMATAISWDIGTVILRSGLNECPWQDHAGIGALKNVSHEPRNVSLDQFQVSVVVVCDVCNWNEGKYYSQAQYRVSK